MNVPGDLYYTNTHEWVRQEDDEVVVGVTDFAQSQLSDLTYVELPAVGDSINANDEAAVLESVKAASDIFSPLSGRISAINDMLTESPELINADPFGEGWLFKLIPEDMADLHNLLDAEAYEALLPDA